MRTWTNRIGWTLAAVSVPVWCASFLVAPFLPVSVAERAAFAGGFVAAGEGLFWLGVALAGPAVVAAMRGPRVRTGEALRGRRVVVVGANGGLGSAIAQAVVREGGELISVVRRPADVPGRVEVATLSDADQRALAARVGPVDHVVVAAGIDVRKALLDHDDDEVDAQLAAGLRGPIAVTRAFLPSLRDGGSVVLLGGFGDGRLALPYYSVDVAARAGLAGFAASATRELEVEGRDARVVYACPAPADTPAERPYADVWAQMGTRLAAPDAVADFVLAAMVSRPRAPALMGFGNRAGALLERWSRPLAHLVAVCSLGPTLRARFGSAR